jgi:nitroreductase
MSKKEASLEESAVAAASRPLGQVIEERRATRSFESLTIPESELEAMLELATRAPSGYNLQPWRFVVVRDPANRQRLSRAALGQQKVAEASAVVVAFALRNSWSENAAEIFAMAAQRGARPRADLEKQRRDAIAFVETLPLAVWLNRHVMIAFTHLMLAAEAMGWDTAPMEGFDPAAVRTVLQLPPDAEVVALLAIGRHREPDVPNPGRLPLEKLVFSETFGQPWAQSSA